ncbi:MAG: hypothetical protein J3K34DRAFT_455864 [Monoraphidium minutum]|nr:MAG: hypothetical protein J3K34DRAFT_455864 [Monoraphidium minutum]
MLSNRVVAGCAATLRLLEGGVRQRAASRQLRAWARAAHSTADVLCDAMLAAEGVPAPAPRRAGRRRRAQHAAGADGRALPWSSLHANVQRCILERKLIPRGASVLVAVSGGQDSLCLAQLLLDLAPHLNLRLAAAHCDHRMRPDSGACAAYVAKWAEERGIECWRTVARAPIQTEAEGREWRYSELARLAAAAGCTHVAAGHTATDRAETLLLNLMRGCGADGLAAMRWARPLGGGGGGGGGGGSFDVGTRKDESEEILRLVRPLGGGGDGGGNADAAAGVLRLVRPLLGVTRQQTGDECMRRGLRPWEDPTNFDLAISRNAVRHRILPLMTRINCGSEGHLAALADVLTAEVACLEEAAVQLLAAARAHAAAEAATGAGGGRAEARRRRRAARRAAEAEALPAGGEEGACASVAPKVGGAPPPHAPAERAGGDPADGRGFCSAAAGAPAPAAAAGSAGVCAGAAGPPALDAVHRRHLLGAHLALQRRALRLWLKEGLGRAPTHQCTEEARRLLAAPRGSKSGGLSGGRWLEVQEGLLVLRGSGGAAAAAGAAAGAGPGLQQCSNVSAR